MGVIRGGGSSSVVNVMLRGSGSARHQGGYDSSKGNQEQKRENISPLMTAIMEEFLTLSGMRVWSAVSLSVVVNPWGERGRCFQKY